MAERQRLVRGACVERCSRRHLDTPPFAPQRCHERRALRIDERVRRPARDAREQRRELELAIVLAVQERIRDRHGRRKLACGEHRRVDRLGGAHEQRDLRLRVRVEAAFIERGPCAVV